MHVPAWALRLPWRHIGAGLVVLVVALAAYNWAHGRGVEKERARLQPQIERLQADKDLLELAVARQNAAIDAIKLDEKKARQVQQEAVRSGAKVAGRVAPHRPALEAVRVTEGLRVTPEAVQAVWEAL